MKKIPLILLVAALACIPSARAADIIGTITLNGTPPPEVPYTPLMNDPTCGAMYTNAPTTHFYVVGPNHGLGDVVVYVKNVTGKSTGASQPPVVLDQKGCLYQPQILAMQTGQKLLVKNSDPCIHNVDVQPTVAGNPTSNQMQPPGSPDLTFTFPDPEMFIKFKCDVHPWMFAWVSVFDSPYYCLSDQEGKFVIKNVPPGKYTVEADHRKLGRLTKEVEVKDSDVTVNFTFDVK
ncbi:MAG: carboxypeptidase regulatory-like domain-containing protein [Verrucomicrobiia bacterium]